MTNYALITCAGIGKRMHQQVNKIFLLLNEKPIISHTLKVFQESEHIDHIVLISREEDKAELKKLVETEGFSKVLDIVLGGEHRQRSVYNGIVSLQEARADDIVLIHNGVNPFVDEKTIRESIEAAKKYEASVVGFLARDTIKKVNEKGFVEETLERKNLWQVQTPQTIRFGTAMKAFKKAFDEEFFGTDDVVLVERLGKKVKMIECPYQNIKITLPNDLEFGNSLLKSARIGFGMDSHRFVKEGEKACVLGGITIPDHLGFDANSDGDIILHALFNAISQAIGERSLGYYADSMFEKGITDSKEYLNVILKIMDERGYALGNIGFMLEGKTPKILTHEDSIKENLSSLLSIDKSNIGITATSGEALSSFGKGLGMQCFCVCTLLKK